MALSSYFLMETVLAGSKMQDPQCFHRGVHSHDPISEAENHEKTAEYVLNKEYHDAGFQNTTTAHSDTSSIISSHSIVKAVTILVQSLTVCKSKCAPSSFIVCHTAGNGDGIRCSVSTPRVMKGM